MRKKTVVFWLLLWVLCCSQPVYGAEAEDIQTYEEELLEKLDVKDLEEYLKGNEYTGDVSFMDLVGSLMTGQIPFDFQSIGTYLADVLWGELSANKGILLQVLLLAVCCSFLHHFSDIFKNSYIADTCFLCLYMELMVLLLRSSAIMYELVYDTLQELVEFMNLLIPIFTLSLSVSMEHLSAAGFYELAFLVIYLVQVILLLVLVPAVKVYVILEFMNHYVPGKKFQKLCELIRDGVQWCLKFLVAVVVSLNVIESMITPAVDRLKANGIAKTVQMLPGVGNAAGVLGEMLLGSGTVIKNSVGVAGILILLLLLAGPVIKLWLLSLLYRVTAAVIEPVSDPRIVGCMQGVYTGSVLLQKIILAAVTLFVTTIAIITAAGSRI
ncbi:MAG: stage III sporulation protein AE [Lachnospiraceae bacterium]|nr:stage III sporulation protein AE [Lachnospiraceae bacterium]